MAQKNSKSNKSFRKAIKILIMALLSLIMLFPYVFMVSSSLKSQNELLTTSFHLIPYKFAFENYAEAMTRGNWLVYFKNSVILTGVTVIVSILINSIAGYSFSRLHFRFRDKIFLLSLIGLMVPPQVTMIPLFIIMKHIPLAGGNNILGQGGMGFINTFWGLLAPFVAGSFGVFLFRQYYLNFPRELDDAASIDGLGKVRTFTHIYLPLSKPVIATLATLKAVRTWNEYTWPLIITVNDKIKTVQLALTAFKDEDTIEWALLMAATTVLTIPLIFIFLVFQKYFIQGIVTSGIKG